jgi:hypothetical protein
MPSPSGKMLEYTVSWQFRQDSGGRTVFLPLISKDEGYFVDSHSDEDKLRALVKLYRGAAAALNLMWSLLNFLAVLAPGSISSFYGGMVPLRDKLIATAWVAALSLLFWGSPAWVLWALYKQAIKTFTHALPQASPELIRRLPAISRRPQRVGLVVLGAVTILAAIAVLLAVQHALR